LLDNKKIESWYFCW